MGKVNDSRTDEQRSTHYALVVGTDSFMSGWGEASGGSSYAAWACRPSDVRTVERWVRARSDMRRVRVVYDTPSQPYRPKVKHLSVYVVEPGHPALGGGE